MATAHGTIKKTDLSLFSNIRQNGIIAINLNDDDRLISAKLTNGQADIILGTRDGIACRFRESDVRPMGRTAAGVRGINLSSEDRVVSMIVIRRPDAQVLVVGEKGYGKRTKYEDFRLTKRGAKGVISMNITPKTGRVVGMLSALDTMDLVVITTKGVLIRLPMNRISTIGRNTQGVKLIRLDQGDTIADITYVTRDEDSIDTNGEEELPLDDSTQSELPMDDSAQDELPLDE